VELRLGATDPGDDRISGWDVDWNDGHVGSFPGDSERATHVYDSRGFYLIHVTATDEDGEHDLAPGVSVDVDAPAPHAGGSAGYVVSEGGTLRLSGSAAGTPTQWAWDLNGDGGFTDAFGKFPSLAWGVLEALGIRDGNANTDGPDAASYHARLRVTYPDGVERFSEADVPIYVWNKPPVATLSDSGPVHEGEDVLLTLWNPWDPSSADREAPFTWLVGGVSFPPRVTTNTITASTTTMPTTTVIAPSIMKNDSSSL